MKKISYVNYWLLVGVVISIYILVAKLFPILQIPFSFLDIEGTTCFNSIMESLAISYLSGVFIYYLTVILKNRIRRRRQKWELYDVLKDHHKVEDITGEKWTLFGEKRYKELTPEQVSGLIEEYDRIIKVLHRYDNVLTEEELDCLHDISQNLDFEVYNHEMLPIEIEKNVGQIKAINQCIAKLQCSFEKLIKH